MSYQKNIYLGLVILLLCVGCGLKEGVVQKEPKSFLWFTGNIQNAIVYIDDLSPIILNKSQASPGVEGGNSTEKSNEIHYEISPGKHLIVIKKMDKEVVNRILLLGNGITREIKIP
jgi:hypothetical protein